MRRRLIVSILIGLTLILSTFISTVSILQMTAYCGCFIITNLAKLRAHKDPGTAVHSIPTSISTVAQNIQQAVQTANKIASATGVGAGVLSPALGFFSLAQLLSLSVI